MAGKWFANRGQVVQTAAAIASACVAIVALYFVLRSNNSLPKASVTLYVSAAIFFLLIGVLIGRLSRPAPSSQSFAESDGTKAREIRNQTATGNSAVATRDDGRTATSATGGNATARIGDIHVHTSPPPQPIAKVDREEIRRKKFDAHPLIVLSEPDVAWLDMDDHEVFRLHRGDPPGHVKAVIISVYYDPDKSLSRSQLEYIRASARFTDRQTKKILVAPALFWIDEYLQWTTLQAGDEKSVVLLVFNNRDGSPVTFANKRRSYGSPLAETNGETVSDSPLPDTEYEVLITFIWGGNDEHRQSHPLQLSKPSTLLSGSGLG